MISKKGLILLFVFHTLFISSVFCQNNASYKNIVVFCKVWGFLKYYHPLVARGRYDWDHEFITKIKVLDSLKTKEQIDNFYYDWIKNLGGIEKSKQEKTIETDALKFNYDLSWIKDSISFSNKVIDLLLQIQKCNRPSRKSYYAKKGFWGLAAISFPHEKPYKDSTFPSLELRLLTLSRYWNIINYFYPYKYNIGENWNEILTEFVPKIIHSKDAKTYHLNLLELFTRIKDSHTSLEDPVLTRSVFSNKMVPFITRIIDNNAVVTGLIDDSLCKKNDIRYGDVFLKINNISIGEIINRLSQYVPASNYTTLCRNIGLLIWKDYSDSVMAYFERNGTFSKKVIYKYPDSLIFASLFKPISATKPKSNKYKVFDNNIAYINLGRITRNEIKNILKSIEGTNAIILDLRNYPDNRIFKPLINFFSKQPEPFIKFSNQDIADPGIYHFTRPFFCGRRNKRAYKGRVVVLINEYTQSFAEYFTMALKTLPNVTLIGTHTAGADGDRVSIVLPGNIITHMSGRGVYYPNGEETQRIGIIPDIIVSPTINGIRERQDEVLNKAIEVLNNK